MLRKISIVSVLIISTVFTLSAQKIKEMPHFESYRKSIYVEFLGSSVLAGVSFDMRLNKGRNDGIGLRAGIGGISFSNQDGSVGLVTLPIEFNHIVGQRHGGFETGIGVLPVYGTISGMTPDNKYVSSEGVTVAGGYLTLGYRYQPINSGFMFQIHWNPMMLRGSGFNIGWFGIGLGVGFK